MSSSAQILRFFLILASIAFLLWSCCIIIPPSFISNPTSPSASLATRNKLVPSHDRKLRSCQLLCLVLSQETPANAAKMRAVQDTWGRRCDELLVVVNGTRLGLDRQQKRIAVPIGAESRRELWHKIFKAFSLVYGDLYLNRCDWFMKADDDTYVIVENLKAFLDDHSPEEPIYFGHKFKPFVRQGYMSGGAGYVLSREALRRLVELGIEKNRTECHLAGGSIEDVEMGLCLESVEVRAGDTRDSQGRPRFLPLSPYELISSRGPKTDYWYSSYQFYEPAKWSKQCCSQEAISFHYIDPQMMRLIDWIIYDMNRKNL